MLSFPEGEGGSAEAIRSQDWRSSPNGSPQGRGDERASAAAFRRARSSPEELLAVVQAVVAQTLRQSDSLEAAQETLPFRLAALGRAADMLTASQWHDAELHELVRAALATHDSMGGRFHIEGPPVRFRSEVALAATLSLHELVTNATKYGALSNDRGHIDLSWSIIRAPNPTERRFVLTWREVGGPPVSPPSRRGFGSLMIERSLRGYFRGELSVTYKPGGLVFHIDAPLRGVQAEGAAE